MSTFGMRRILKRVPSPYQHMKAKFEAGLYDGEYPLSYQIMQLDPPVPDPVGVLSDLKHRPNKGNIVLPTDPLVRNYIRRNGGYSSKAAKDYYYRPEQQVGIGDIDAHMGYNANAKGNISEAYYFASRQYEYMQKHWREIEKEDGMTEEEIVANVEALLEDEGQAERFKSRTNSKEVKKESEESPAAEKEEGSLLSVSKDGDISPEVNDEPKVKLEGLPTMLNGNPKAVQQMTMWSERLQQVPYSRWTVGAATALDHWIASEILGLSARTWQAVLRRSANSGTRGIATDIITVRSALFPETTVDDDEFQSVGDADDHEFSSAGSSNSDSKGKEDTEKSIDDLLASLGVKDEDENDQFWNTTGGSGDGDDEDGDDPNESHDTRFTRMRIELNQWQGKNAETPYEQWNETETKNFNTWLAGYIATITEDLEEGENSHVDLSATRKAIFDEPYFPHDDDELMWMAMGEDTEAEMVLRELLDSRDQMLKDGVLTAEEHAQWKLFENLDFKEQLTQMRSMHALKNITEDPRSKIAGMSQEKAQSFVSDHVEHLRDGVAMEELSPDVDGLITSKDLYDLPEDEHRFKYSLREMEAGDEKQRAHDDELHQEWGRFSANVANNEENLYELGVLGLDRTEAVKQRQLEKEKKKKAAKAAEEQRKR